MDKECVKNLSDHQMHFPIWPLSRKQTMKKANRFYLRTICIKLQFKSFKDKGEAKNVHSFNKNQTTPI